MSALTIEYLIISSLTAVELFQYRNKIITELYSDSHLQKAIRNITYSNDNNEYTDELKQELFLHLSEQKPEKIIQLKQQGRDYFYCLKYLTTQFHSKAKGSDFWYKFKSYDQSKLKSEQFDLTDETELSIKEDLEINYLPRIKELILKLDWYDQLIFSYYTSSDMTLRQLSKRLDIPLMSIYCTIDKVRTIIKQKIKDEKLFD